MFKKLHEKQAKTAADDRYYTIIDMGEGLTPGEFEKLLKVVKDVYRSYSLNSGIKTRDQKLVAYIDKIEHQMDVIKENDKK